MQLSRSDRSPAPRRLWVTRAEPGASETAARLRALGFEVEPHPLLTVALADSPPELAGLAALAFTSANGVRSLAALTPRRDFKVFAVGEATAAAARAAGFGDVTTGAGDGRALAEQILAEAPRGVVGVAGPEVPAFDVAAALQAAGAPARRLVLYRTVPATELSPSLRAVLEAGALHGVLVHSARAADALAGLALEDRHVQTLVLYGLSEACVAPLRPRPWRAVKVAPSPQDAALLKLLS